MGEMMMIEGTLNLDFEVTNMLVGLGRLENLFTGNELRLIYFWVGSTPWGPKQAPNNVLIFRIPSVKHPPIPMGHDGTSVRSLPSFMHL